MKSDGTQHLWLEIPFEQRMMESFVAPQYIDPLLVDEERGLVEALKARLRELVNTKLTPHQTKYLTGHYYDGRTQQEVADMYGVSQDCIVKSCRGNYDYSTPGVVRMYGGSFKKLRRAVAVDPQTQDILARLKVVRALLAE